MKINLLLISIFIAVISQAQVPKGAILLGGDISANGSNYKNTTSNQTTWENKAIYFSPSLGIAVKDNLVAGVRLIGSVYSNENQPNNYTNKGNAFGGGFWIRKYLPLGNTFYVFGDAGLNGQSAYRKQTDAQQPLYYIKETGYSVGATLYPGVAYRVRKHLFLEVALSDLLTLGYSSTNVEQQNQDGTSFKGRNQSYNLSGNFSDGVPLQIGMRWIFSK